MRSPLTALQAFSRDAHDTTDASHDTDPRLAGWLAVAKAAERISAMRHEARAPYASSLARTVLPPSTVRPTLRHDRQGAPTEPIAQFAERLRVEAEEMERAGCYEMAFTTVSAVCRLARETDLVSQLTATAHLGRIARQLGDSTTATDCYECVVTEASRVRDGPLGALGLLGLGNLARSRGNRPEERRLFSLALSLAHPGGTGEFSAQQGLMLLAMSEHRLPDALVHGWRAFDLSDEGSDARAIALSNLAFAALHGNFPGAALSGFLHTLSMTTVARIRLTSIGGAMRAAAARRNRSLVAELAATGQREAAVANVPFEIATFSFGGGQAWQTLHEWDAAVAMLTRSRDIARTHRFSELSTKADEALGQIEFARSVESVATPWVDDARQDAVVPGGIERLEALAV